MRLTFALLHNSPVEAQYVFRFDDFCPSMDHLRWSKIEHVLVRHSVKPILAVVPDNRDPKLICGNEDESFWTRLRALQQEAWTIALHGYQHLCVHRGKSLIPIHRESEFAGLPEAQQREKIERGLDVLRDRGLEPHVWVAPKHSFDRGTLSALRASGIDCVSDGYALYPYVADQVFWIPQQMARLRSMPLGVWTFCLHPNSMSDASIATLNCFLAAHRTQLTSVPEVRRAFSGRTKSLGDIVFQKACHGLLKWRRSQTP